MNNISGLGSSVGGLQNRGDFGEFASTSEKREALQASQSKNLELSLTTKEGDTVTLSAASFTDFASLSYDRSGKITNGSQSASARFSSRDMTLSSGSEFTFTVKGSLSEQEMDDIENIVKTLDEVVNKMSTGNMDDAVAKALELDKSYDNVSGFEADLSYSSSYQLESENHLRGENQFETINQDNSGVQLTGLNEDQALPDVPKDSSSRLMEMMLKELDKLQEKNQEIPRKAADPIDQLLAHHMDQIKKMRENHDSLVMNQKDGLVTNKDNSLVTNQKDDLDVKQDDSLNTNMDSLLNELDNAKKAMADKFNKMMPELKSFSKMLKSSES